MVKNVLVIDIGNHTWNGVAFSGKKSITKSLAGTVKPCKDGNHRQEY
jgi:hypothetical protein